MRTGRNMLSLQARVAPRSFDTQSASFERQMMVALRDVFCRAFPNVKTNARLPKNLGGEELDLMVFDEKTTTLLIAEARATIMPADPVEVFRRLTEIQRKVNQLQRKISSVRQRLDAILKWAGLKTVAKDWTVVGTVIMRGHAGALSNNPEIPVVPEYIISAGVSLHCSAKRLHGWLAGLSWLPQQGIHFKTIATTHTFGECQLQFYGISDVKPMNYLKEYLPATIAAFRE